MVVICGFYGGHLLPIYLLWAIYSFSGDPHSTPVPKFWRNRIRRGRGGEAQTHTPADAPTDTFWPTGSLKISCITVLLPPAGWLLWDHPCMFEISLGFWRPPNPDWLSSTVYRVGLPIIYQILLMYFETWQPLFGWCYSFYAAQYIHNWNLTKKTN